MWKNYQNSYFTDPNLYLNSFKVTHRYDYSICIYKKTHRYMCVRVCVYARVSLCVMCLYKEWFSDCLQNCVFQYTSWFCLIINFLDYKTMTKQLLCAKFLLCTKEPNVIILINCIINKVMKIVFTLMFLSPPRRYSSIIFLAFFELMYLLLLS